MVGPYLLPLLFAVSGYLFAYLGYKRHTDLARVLGFKGLLQQPGAKQFMRPKLLDTSAIIDGRIGDVVATGFLEGDLVDPQLRAGGAAIHRRLGRAGQAGPGPARARHRAQPAGGQQPREHHRAGLPQPCREVDAKLIKLAKEMKACILTTDYNLNKVSQIQGVEVLNVNELAHTLKAVVLPGESLGVRVLREGKEEDQGVAYLDDGTMVVIEGGRQPGG